MDPSKPRAEPAADDRGTATPDALFHAHAQAVFAVCLANTRNYHDAEDLMQAVFLKAIAKISSLREPARARAWLLQAARRQCIDFHRRRKRAEPLRDEPSISPSRGSAQGERLHEALQKLPQNFREVIALYYLDGRDCSGVAASLGATEAAIRQRLVRARAILHDLLQEERT
jgi:RNA polymerase sigma factor (sigma-70 family)